MKLIVGGQLLLRKVAPSPNSNANNKPNPNPNRGGGRGHGLFLGGICPDTYVYHYHCRYLFLILSRNFELQRLPI